MNVSKLLLNQFLPTILYHLAHSTSSTWQLWYDCQLVYKKKYKLFLLNFQPNRFYNEMLQTIDRVVNICQGISASFGETPKLNQSRSVMVI